jgi:hypothetical protein
VTPGAITWVRPCPPGQSAVRNLPPFTWPVLCTPYFARVTSTSVYFLHLQKHSSDLEAAPRRRRRQRPGGQEPKGLFSTPPSNCYPSPPLCLGFQAVNLNLRLNFCSTQGYMGQDPGDEILAAKGLFRFEQASQGLFLFGRLNFCCCWRMQATAFTCMYLWYNVFLQDPTKTRFCAHDQEIEQAYVELLDSSKQTLGCMLQLQEVWLPAFISASMLRYSSPYCTFSSFLTLCNI